MRIDLHTHSRMSDGTQTPFELITAAALAGLDVVALTDHDTTSGWDQAAEAAAQVGVDLVRGIEISTWHRTRAVHLLAYLPDPTWPPLTEALAEVLAGREARLPRMLHSLADVGVHLDFQTVERLAGGTAATGRPHVADAMVAAGYVRDRDQAFREYLNPGRPGYVDRGAIELTAMIGIVAEAGGVSVVAHPWGRHQPDTLTREDLAYLRQIGLAGIEVDHQDHDAASRHELRAIAGDLDLVITGSSDHHGAGKTNHELGCNTTDPAHYERLIELTRLAAGRSLGKAPGVLHHR